MTLDQVCPLSVERYTLKGPAPPVHSSETSPGDFPRLARRSTEARASADEAIATAMKYIDGVPKKESYLIRGENALVGNDASWTQIARDQVAYLGDDVATVLRPTEYETVAQGLGARGFSVRSSGDIAPALTAARETARAGIPALVNVHLAPSAFRQGSISM